jgi:hypothetical protein
MQATSLHRRRFLAGAALCAALPWPALAQALAPPSGKVMLTLTGALRQRNTATGAAFDMVMLQSLPRHSFSTRTPWYSKQPRTFTGVLLRDLLAAVGGQATRMHATALNDYSADIPASDWTDNDALLAYWLDGKPMSVREKGPLVVIFPFDDHPELRTAVHYGRSIWQLTSIDLR